MSHLEGTLLVLDVVLGRREKLEEDVELVRFSMCGSITVTVTYIHVAKRIRS